MARTQLFVGSNGDRPNVPNVAVVITDGMSTWNSDKTLPEATLLQKNATVFVIGVTNLVNVSEIMNISSSPRQQNVTYWLLNEYSDLLVYSAIGSILDDLCEGQYVSPYGGGWYWNYLYYFIIRLRLLKCVIISLS